MNKNVYSNYIKIFDTKALIVIFLCSLTLSYLAANRFLGIDRDYFQYLLFFNNVNIGYEGRFELGFVLFSIAIKFLFSSFFVFLFSSALISVFLKLYLLTRLDNSVVLSVLYILILFSVHEMTQIRVSMGLAFSYLGLYLASVGKKIWIRMLIGLLGVFFHWSLLIFLPFIFFWDKFVYCKIRYVLLFLFATTLTIYSSIEFFVFLNPQVISMMDNAYLMEANPISSRNIVFLISLGIGFYNYYKIPKQILPWFYISLMGVILWYGLVKVPIFSHRLLEATIFSYFFWISFLPNKSKIMIIFLFFVLGCYLVFKMIYLGNFFRI